jgi:hypothetical protein
MYCRSNIEPDADASANVDAWPYAWHGGIAIAAGKLPGRLIYRVRQMADI